jgi:hypothetical protein
VAVILALTEPRANYGAGITACTIFDYPISPLGSAAGFITTYTESVMAAGHPSTPGLPLFDLTRCNACLQFSSADFFHPSLRSSQACRLTLRHGVDGRWFRSLRTRNVSNWVVQPLPSHV